MRLALLRILQMLAFWMALTFIVVPVMGVVMSAVFLLVPNVAVGSDWDVLKEMAWLPPAGVALLWLGRWLENPIGDIGTPGGWRGAWRRAARAVLLPTADDALQDYTIFIEQPMIQVVAHLEELPAPRGGWWGALTRRKGEAMARVSFERIALMAGMGASFWQGELESAGATTVVRSAPIRRGCAWKFACFHDTAPAVVIALISVGAMAGAIANPPARNITTLGLVFFLVLWLTLFMAQQRLAQFLSREHERALERFWRAHFDARIERTARRRWV